jgi:hypothetical protein
VKYVSAQGNNKVEMKPKKKRERDPGKEKGIAKWDSRGKRVKNKRSDVLGVGKKKRRGRSK